MIRRGRDINACSRTSPLATEKRGAAPPQAVPPTGRSLALRAGRQWRTPYADRLVRLADEAERELRSEQPLGAWGLGLSSKALHSGLAPVLWNFHRRYPGVVVELWSRAPSGS